MQIALIDYHMGNLHSVENALKHLGFSVETICDSADLQNFSAAVLPGVGNFGDGADNLQRMGFYPAIREFVTAQKKLLGICLGMQLMFDASEEAPGATGLGLISGNVVRFRRKELKIPHIGWNEVRWENNPFFTENGFFYFVHSYYGVPTNEREVAGVCDYGEEFTVAVKTQNCFGVQFHPEKSQEIGLKLIKSFFDGKSDEATRKT